jgi:hypothetical protein
MKRPLTKKAGVADTPRLSPDDTLAATAAATRSFCVQAVNRSASRPRSVAY